MKRLAFLFIISLFLTSTVLADTKSVTVQWDSDVRNIEGGTPIEQWNSYPLAIGNEITLERDWLGEIYFVAIYDRMLKGYEAQELFDRGVDNGNRLGEIAKYLFNENGGATVTDSIDPALNLNISGDVTWINGGIRINATTLISSSQPATKIMDAVNTSKAFTIEAWVKASNLTQGGPARIVSMSPNSGERNFTLGQTENSWIVRCFRKDSGPNGYPQIEAIGKATTNLTHLLFTIDNRGAGTLYVNGIAEGSTNHTFPGTGNTPWEQVKIYDRYEDTQYDYDNPLATVSQVYDANGYSKPIKWSGDIEVRPNEIAKKYVVARSAAGSLESADSDEVFVEYDTTAKQPPAPLNNLRITSSNP